MDFDDRATAIQALASCDRAERGLLDGDQELIEELKELARRWAADVDEYDLRSAVKCIRARANEILAEERNEH